MKHRIFIENAQQDKAPFRGYKTAVRRAVCAVLEEEGFITRTPSEADKRVMELYPTEKTLKLMPEITEILNKWEDFLLADLSEEEVEQVHSVLRRMRDKASGWMEAH